MGYEQAINNAWQALEQSQQKEMSITFINQSFQVNPGQRQIISPADLPPLDEHQQILLLHYLAAEAQVGEVSNDRWISFKELDGGEIYFPSFRKRSVDRILAKFGSRPESIFAAMPRLSAEKLDQGTAAISFYPFAKIHMAIIIWAGDDEFPPECNILFNCSIKQILCTEDTAVLGGVVASII